MLAMAGSSSEHSYAQHSASQNSHFHSVAKPRLAQAIKHLLCKSSRLDRSQGEASDGKATIVLPRHHFAVADVGCSYGRNTLDCAEFVVRTLIENFVSGKEDAASSHNVMEIQYFFSDLPSNDFNALFQSLEPYLHGSGSGISDRPPKFFAAGVPGSFYGRLFPTSSLDIVICSSSLHWLSQVPPSLVDKFSPAWNGGHTWIISRAKPSNAVADAYARQSEVDVKRFLRSRAHELRSGGILFLVWASRSVSAQHHVNDFLRFEDSFEFLNDAWKEMVDEGLIASEEMEMFNMAFYFFNQKDLEGALKDMPEWRVVHMETMNDRPVIAEQGDRTQTVEQWVGMMASTIKPAVEAHVGKSKADELFKKLKSICLTQARFDARLTHNSVVATLQRL